MGGMIPRKISNPGPVKCNLLGFEGRFYRIATVRKRYNISKFSFACPIQTQILLITQNNIFFRISVDENLVR